MGTTVIARWYTQNCASWYRFCGGAHLLVMTIGLGMSFNECEQTALAAALIPTIQN
jgi:hypothetical protein